MISVPPMFTADGVKLLKDVCPEIKNMPFVLLIVLMDGIMKDNLVLETFMELLKTLPLKLLDISPLKWLPLKLTLIPLLTIKLLSTPLLFWDLKLKRKKSPELTLSPDNQSLTILGMSLPPLLVKLIELWMFTLIMIKLLTLNLEENSITMMFMSYTDGIDLKTEEEKLEKDRKSVV